MNRKKKKLLLWILIPVYCLVNYKFITVFIDIFQDIFISQRINGSWIIIAKKGDAIWPFIEFICALSFIFAMIIVIVFTVFLVKFIQSIKSEENGTDDTNDVERDIRLGK